MTRHFIAIALMLSAALALHAQTGIIDIHPENPEGRLLTPELLLDASILPARYKSPAQNTTEPVAYSQGGNLFCKDASGEYVATFRSEGEGIVYGETVSRNEFGIDGGIFPSPKENKIAFYRKDERAVTLFPLLDITSRTGSLKSIRYPMNGMASEHISLGILDRKSGLTVWADVTDFDVDRYLTNISWSPDEKYVFIQVVDRSQHHMHLNMYDSVDGSFVRTILSEDNEAWVEPQWPISFIKDSYRFVYTTDNRDGFRNLYLCDTTGLIRRLTTVDADVQYVANDGRYLYYYSAELSPAEQHLFRLDLKKKKASPENLTPERGWHTVEMADDCASFIDTYSSINVPRIVLRRNADGSIIEKLLVADDPLAGFASGEVVFGSVQSADGKYQNHYRLIKPVGFDPSRKYPLIVYVYGGPHSQMVNDSWLGKIRMWEMMMAQQGYVVYVQDNRGTMYHGAGYEKAINRECGQMEMEDQMVGVRMLMEQPWVDSGRIGVHGWSYGGFMTVSLMTSYPEIFKVAVAGGPVIDWKWYEIMYGERYMDTMETNPEGFAMTSLMGKAGAIKGKLLICQGAIDNTVVDQHCLSFIQECVEKGVQLDFFMYPRSEHNVMGSWRAHLHRKITDYFNLYL